MTIRVNCYQCRHYYVTWDQNFPHGCRKLDFKSRVLPSIEVKKNSGIPCLYFKSKKKGPDKPGPPKRRI